MSTNPSALLAVNDAETVVLTYLKHAAGYRPKAVHLHDPLGQSGFYQLICLALNISTKARLP